MSNQRYNLSQAPGTGPLPLQLSFPAPEQEGDGSPLEARLLYISTARYDRDWHCTPHTHSFCEIFYVTGGRGRFQAEGRALPLRKGGLVIVNPYVEHAEASQDQEPLEYIVLGIEGLEFSLPDGSPGSGCLCIPTCSDAIDKYIRSLLTEARTTAFGHKNICQHLLSIILISILRQKEMNIAITASQGVPAFCAVVKSYLDTHYKEAITLDMLADEVRQNKFYLVHAFTKAYSMSPIKYLMKRKMDESKYLLAETDTSIADIGAIVGFSSASHFTQAFKRIVGCTPNAYRKQRRGAEEE